MGTGSMMPSLTSWSSPAFTSAFQLWGTLTGGCTATGTSPSTKEMSSGFPVISCNGWCGQVLKAEAAYRLKIHCSNCSQFSSTPGSGISVGRGGGRVLVGQLHTADLRSHEAWLGLAKSSLISLSCFKVVFE